MNALKACCVVASDHKTNEMILSDNEITLKCNPFKFEVRLKYEVLPGKLLCHQNYKNVELS
ncbi:MAG: hypothetical protein NTZ67_08220 [Gammaproteobacteria bacterium]|nr:hypothetical protein [Gammaproteobacteria bacterium]